MKTKVSKEFPEYIIQNWEASDGVNFAIALARITGWILQVDWWSPSDNEEIVDNMKPLRVYVCNNSNQIYDIKGKQTITTFIDRIIMPLAQKRGSCYGGIVSRFYSERELFNLPLRIKPNEAKIQEVQKNICNNTDYLEKIPLRDEPKVPAHIAAKFTFGYCNPFAEALRDLKGYKPIAIIAKEYNEQFELSNLGYAHSFVLDKDDNAMDIWGIDSVENIIQRFGITRYELDESAHLQVNQTLKRNSQEKYNEVYEESVAIIKEYFR